MIVVPRGYSPGQRGGRGSEQLRINTTTIRTTNPTSPDIQKQQQASPGTPATPPHNNNNNSYRSETKFYTKGATSTVAQAKRILDRVLKDLDDVDSGYSGSGGTLAGSTLSSDEIKDRIRKYNDNHQTSKITQELGRNETFQGDIQVNICLDQPVNMMLQARPVSAFDVFNKSGQTQCRPEDSIRAKVTLPRNTVMGLHLSSQDSAECTIQKLLAKFDIMDDSKGFSLYEQTLCNEKEVKLRKIASNEQPLLSYLRWNTESKEGGVVKRFVLKESDTAEILWEAFSLPELSNFLKMLDFEQHQHAELIRTKYTTVRKNIENRLKELASLRTVGT